MIDNIDHNKEAADIYREAMEKERKKRKWNPDELIAMYSRVIELEPEFPHPYFLRGRQYLEFGDIANALKNFTQAIELGFQDAETYYERMKCYALIGNKDNEALADLRAALKIDPFHVNANCDMGLICFEKGDMQRAYKHFTTAINRNTSNAITFLKRGVINMQEKRYEHAIVDFLDSKACNPTIAQTHYLLGNCYYELGVLKRALRAYDSANLLDRDMPDIYYKMGCVCYDMGDFDSSARHFSILIELLPDSETGYTSRGLAWLAKEDFDKAIADFEKAISINAGDASAHYLLSQAYLGRGDEALGIKYYERALALGYVPE
ncbi:MAG: tetratricopeptide repeat protein [Clostridiales bacterium]|nr:tetratricopeptide repeat protein [Clostridiales bacterium]